MQISSSELDAATYAGILYLLEGSSVLRSAMKTAMSTEECKTHRNECSSEDLEQRNYFTVIKVIPRLWEGKIIEFKRSSVLNLA